MTLIPASETLKVAVVGAGQMGRNHLRCYARITGVEIVGVVDPDMARAAAVAAEFGGAAFVDPAGLPDVDLVSIATPSIAHAATARHFIDLGVHCLVEKPLALTAADGRELAARARARGVALGVGHLERFNPAVRALKACLPEVGRIRAVTARRLARASRIVDVDVVDDLMIHDLDILLDLLGRPALERAVVEGLRGHDIAGFDHATALLTLGGGILASLSASRLTPVRIRSFEVIGDEAVATADLLAQELTIARPGLDPVHVTPEKEEPLLAELTDFAQAVRAGRPPCVDAAQAVDALSLAEAIKNLYMIH